MKGASVYQRKGRPVWYISYYPRNGYNRVHEATQFRIEDPTAKGKAYELALERAKLHRIDEGNAAERWHVWVVPYLEDRYRRSPLTHSRYLTSWKYWQRYFDEHDLAGPRVITFQHISQYLKWRTSQKKRSGKLVSHNTAMTDVQCLRVVMAEVVRRGWRLDNPVRELGISRDAAKEKCEITDSEMATIIAALDKLVAEKPHKDWMRISWEIARWQGCRLSETQFDIRRHVNFAENTIKFRGKGGVIIHTMLHPQLKPYLQNMLKSGRTFTCKFPKMGVAPAGASAKFFRHFFDCLDMPHISFHCTRVTVITKLIRAGQPIAQVMAFIGHADEEVNRIYRKLKPRDLGAVTAALSYTPPSGQTPS